MLIINILIQLTSPHNILIQSSLTAMQIWRGTNKISNKVKVRDQKPDFKMGELKLKKL